MDLNTFLFVAKNVHEAKHGKEVIYVGNEVMPERWLAFFNGKEIDLDSVNSLEEAEVAAHRLFDNAKTCSFELEWKIRPESLTSIVELATPDFTDQ
ncbi:MAG: hypothetical protein WBM14_14845 [Terracidiphilus sp.]|jgi:CO dehydrogenase/acetyl-CoA synthase gamma subunit (corrinoid Fe-S protein)